MKTPVRPDAEIDADCSGSARSASAKTSRLLACPSLALPAKCHAVYKFRAGHLHQLDIMLAVVHHGWHKQRCGHCEIEEVRSNVGESDLSERRHQAVRRKE